MPASKAIEKVMERIKDMDPITKEAYLQCYRDLFNYTITTTQAQEKNRLMNNRIIGLIGLIGLIAMMAFVYLNPYATKWQSGFWWIGACVFTGACAAAIPGMFEFKIHGLLKAGGAIGVAVFMYYSPPSIMDKDFDKPKERLRYFTVLTDTAAMATIPVDYSSHSSENICTFSKTAMVHFYGTDLEADTLVFYRKSDGKIYSTEKCSDLTETDIIAISNKIVRLIGTPRLAYEYIYAKSK